VTAAAADPTRIAVGPGSRAAAVRLSDQRRRCDQREKTGLGRPDSHLLSVAAGLKAADARCRNGR